MTTTLSDTLANAVEAARALTLRLETGRRPQSATVFDKELLVTSQRGLRGSDHFDVYDDAGTGFKAELVGSDEALDLALLRASGASFTAPRVADHAALRTGQLAVALGRPGVAIRATLRMIGLLSGELRTPGGARLERYIESDRGLPEGFEGGPQVDETGALIGMNSSYVLRGADLSLPHATLVRSVAELSAHGRIRRGYLGVACQQVRLPAALRSALDQRSGALVLDTDESGPARAAGITLGDVIVKIDTSPIRGPRDLVRNLRDKLGAPIELGIIRSGQLQTLSMTVAERG